MDPRNEVYLEAAYKQLAQVGIKSPDRIRQINEEFQQARQMLRKTLGAKYDSEMHGHKQALQGFMQKNKVTSPLLAARMAMEAFDRSPEKPNDPLGVAKLMIMAAALDLLDPEIFRN